MTLFEHIVEQYPPEIKKKKYEYWSMIREANADYRKKHQHDSVHDEIVSFKLWMEDQWGVDIELTSEGISPYYKIVEEKKYIMFQLKYGSK